MDFLAELGRWFLENWDGTAGYANRTWEHLQVSVASVAAAAVLAIPVAAVLGHYRRGGLLAVSVVNIGRAVPSFGIVALALPITIRLAARFSFIPSGLGFFPTFIALFALALPPIFTNTYTAVREVDPGTVEAARGVGIPERTILTTIEMPMASPVIIAGLRVASVQVVATATLGAIVAFGGLGRYIIDGFALQDDVQLVAGALLVALLAIGTEVAFGIAERALVPAGLRRAAEAATGN